MFAHPGRLFGDEYVEGHFAALHHVQCLFPDGRSAGVGDGTGHGVDQAKGGGGRRQGLAVFAQVATIEQALDDSGAGGFGACDPLLTPNVNGLLALAKVAVWAGDELRGSFGSLVSPLSRLGVPGPPPSKRIVPSSSSLPSSWSASLQACSPARGSSP